MQAPKELVERNGVVGLSHVVDVDSKQTNRDDVPKLRFISDSILIIAKKIIVDRFLLSFHFVFYDDFILKLIIVEGNDLGEVLLV